MNEAPKAHIPLSDSQQPIRVLLVDDQSMVGEAVRRMLANEPDIEFHYCGEPERAIPCAEEIQPTVILQDLVMPDVDGLTLVKFYRGNPATRYIPLIVLSVKEDPQVKAQAFSLGANDYLVKLPDAVEMIARIRYHSQAYLSRIEREEAYRQLKKSQARLSAELAEAAEYVRSLLPPPAQGEIDIQWQFIPSTQLGGDSFGYHWVDERHFAIYLIDVSGHGVGAALLSVSVINALRNGALSNTDFNNPSEVLTRLNQSFQMADQNGMFFTIWYGVYDPVTRQLEYASGGHPPGLLVQPDGGAIQRLTSRGLIIGIDPELTYASETYTLGVGDTLFLYSDGVYEVRNSAGQIQKLEHFEQLIAQLSGQGRNEVQEIHGEIVKRSGQTSFEDDFSIMRLQFH